MCAELERKRPGPPDPVKRCRMACGALVQEAYKRGSEERMGLAWLSGETFSTVQVIFMSCHGI